MRILQSIIRCLFDLAFKRITHAMARHSAEEKLKRDTAIRLDGELVSVKQSNGLTSYLSVG